MLAVDPPSQVRCVGTALTEHATNLLRDEGMRVAMISPGATGVMPPARRDYEEADNTLSPVAGCYEAL